MQSPHGRWFYDLYPQTSFRSFDQGGPLVGTNPKEAIADTHEDFCTVMFIIQLLFLILNVRTNLSLTIGICESIIAYLYYEILYSL